MITRTRNTQQQELTPDQQSKAERLLKIVRESTERFKDVAVAEAEGYRPSIRLRERRRRGAMGSTM